MAFRDTILGLPRPGSIRAVKLPRREAFHPSPVDWRNEVLYFLLPDRFSDGKDKTRPVLDRSNLTAARPASFKFNEWAASGSGRFQGGTIAGTSRFACARGRIRVLSVSRLLCGGHSERVDKRQLADVLGHTTRYRRYGL